MSIPTKDVNLLVTPLAMYYEHHLDDLDLAAHCSPLHRAPFRRLQHWAIQVGHTVYEVTRRGADPSKPTLRRMASSDWWDECDDRHATVRRHFLGVTYDSKTKLFKRAESVWSGVMKEYNFATTNCQTFASIFQEWIVDNDKLSRERQADVQPLPWPFNPFVSIGEKVSLAKDYAARSDRAAARWLRQYRNKSQRRQPPSIPRRPTSTWLDAFKNESRHPDTSTNQDFYNIVQMANGRLRPPQRRTTWQRLYALLSLQTPKLRLKD